MTEQNEKDVAKIIRRRCCSAANGRDISEFDAMDIAREIMRATDVTALVKYAQSLETENDRLMAALKAIAQNGLRVKRRIIT